MVKVALLVRVEATPGKEDAVATFLSGALPLAEKEPAFSMPSLTRVAVKPICRDPLLRR